MELHDVELYDLAWHSHSSIPLENIVESATIIDNFEFYGKTTLNLDFPERVDTPEFIEKFERFGGVIKDNSYILPSGLDVTVSISKSDGILDIKRNGVTLTINKFMGDVCKFEVTLTKLGDIIFKALKFHEYDTTQIMDIINELEFYSKLFKVKLDDFI